MKNPPFPKVIRNFDFHILHDMMVAIDYYFRTCELRTCD